MKKAIRLFVLLTALTPLSNTVSARIDAKLRVRAYAESRNATTSRSDSGTTTFIPVIVKADSPEAADYLHEIGTVIFGQRGNLIIGCVPSDHIDLLDDNMSIATATAATSLTTTLDVALDAAAVNPIHAGTGFLSPYDGTGVVAGLCDVGFDPHHESFDSRVALITAYDTRNAMRTEVRHPENAPGHTATESYHATHVASIMAGGTQTSTPYHGAAPGAEIVASVSDLTDVGILAGIDDIIAYAQEAGKPAVVNLSLASYVGPHDGSSLFNQYLDMQSDEAIICIAAGNNGNQPYTLSHTFTTDSDKLRTVISTWDFFNPSGMIDIWNSDDSPIQTALGIWDSDLGEWIAFTPYIEEATIDTRNDDCDKQLQHFAGIFDGYITVASEINSENGRFHTVVSFDYLTSVKSSQGEWGRYRIALMIRARQGSHVDMFSDGVNTMLRAIKAPGFENGNSMMSINDLACSRGAIAVGMVNDRSAYPLADGSSFTDSFTDGTVSPNSSYGTLRDGRVLPHITAPGNHVVAALNKVYHDLHPSSMPVVAESRSADGRLNLWTAAGGTSMASPLVAGTIATWLQARPDLNVDEVRRALIITARTDISDAGDRRYGASGQLDATAGLRHILASDAIKSVPSRTESTLVLTTTQLNAPGAHSIILYDMTGRIAASSRAETIAISNLARGIYIAEILTGQSTTRTIITLH